MLHNRCAIYRKSQNEINVVAAIAIRGGSLRYTAHWLRLTVVVAGLAAISIKPTYAQAPTQKFSGDIWTEADSGRIVKGSDAVVYLWPDDSAVTNVINSACAASTADMTAWMVARQVLNDTTPGVPLSATVTHDLALLHTIAQLPHAIVQADSLGHFTFDSIPPGSYWVEAETILNGRFVQWWKHDMLLRFPFRVGGSKTATLVNARLGPVELHSSQFCTSPEARVGAAAFITDTPIEPPDHIYENIYLDQPVRVLNPGRLAPYPESMLKLRVPGEVTLNFVVNLNGRADLNSVRVLRSTDPAFIDPATRTLATMQFAPAQIQGRPVRSRATQPFTFTVQP